MQKERSRKERDRQPAEQRLALLQERLWREAPADVMAMYDAVLLGGLELSAPPETGSGQHGLLSDRMRELYRPLPYRDRAGVTITEMASQSGIRRGTLARLLEHYGYLEMVPYGGQQRRRLVTDQAFHAGCGHNVDGSRTRITAIDGMNRAVVFPVFYPECVPDILWSLDYAGIAANAASISSKRKRMRWLLGHHSHLPDAELAALAGYSLKGVEKARASITPDRTLVVRSEAVTDEAAAQSHG